MKKYEAMLVLENAFGAKAWEDVEAELRKLIERFDGQVESATKWADRRLAYEINKQKRAVYVLILFEMDPEKIRELREQCVLDERILRVLVLAFNPRSQKHLEAEPHPFGRGSKPVSKPKAEKAATSEEAASAETATPEAVTPKEAEAPAQEPAADQA